MYLFYNIKETNQYESTHINDGLKTSNDNFLDEYKYCRNIRIKKKI